MNNITFVNESKLLNQADAAAIGTALGIFVGQVCTAWG